MTYHARPLPPPPGTAAGAVATTRVADGTRTDPDASPGAGPAGTPPPPPVDAAAPRAEPTHAPAVPAEPSAAEAGRPWYRSEPWAAAALAAFVPMGAAVVAPQPLRVPLIGLGALLVLVACALLVRQGLFREHGAASSAGPTPSPKARRSDRPVQP